MYSGLYSQKLSNLAVQFPLPYPDASLIHLKIKPFTFPHLLPIPPPLSIPNLKHVKPAPYFCHLLFLSFTANTNFHLAQSSLIWILSFFFYLDPFLASHVYFYFTPFSLILLWALILFPFANFCILIWLKLQHSFFFCCS